MLRQCIWRLLCNGCDCQKIITTGYYWLKLFKDTRSYCNICTLYQLYRKKTISQGQMHSIIPIEQFKKWGVDFVGPLLKTQRINQLMIVHMDYTTKELEARIVKMIKQEVATSFIYTKIACTVWVCSWVDNSSKITLYKCIY